MLRVLVAYSFCVLFVGLLPASAMASHNAAIVSGSLAQRDGDTSQAIATGGTSTSLDIELQIKIKPQDGGGI